MAFKEIPRFPLHSSEMTVIDGPRLLSQGKFAVLVFAASGISAHSRIVAKAQVTSVVEGQKRQNYDLGPRLLQFPKYVDSGAYKVYHNMSRFQGIFARI
jgi:hypothetical protein